MTKLEAHRIEQWAWAVDDLEAEDRDDLFRTLLHDLIENAEPYEIEMALDLMTRTDLEDGKLEIKVTPWTSEPKTEPKSYPTEPEAIYTGGGFWISCSWISDHEYVAISNEDEIPELAVYDNDGEDGYECNNMIDEILLPDMTESDLKLYQKLYTTLQKAINNDCEIRH